MTSLSFSHLVELHHPLHPAIPVWPGDPPVQFDEQATVAEQGFALRRIILGEHSGTHLNAPAHFFPGGATVEQIPPRRLVLPAAVIDARPGCSANADHALDVAELDAWEAVHGRIPPGSLVILFSGWQDRWQDPRRFFNQDAGGRCHFPGFSLEAARFLIEARAAAGLGSDAHGVEPGLDEGYSVNRYALARSALVLENLCNLHLLPPLGATVAIGLPRLQGGSGAPVAVLAFVP